jgi:hypothetical protein
MVALESSADELDWLFDRPELWLCYAASRIGRSARNGLWAGATADRQPAQLDYDE